ncbi:MAG: hypothetical protein LBU89_14075 [Fibromonadaceae bacterium]|jgi:hypothetical protein|nr:hypothetical protein [Fibromonadaceae bacterium]
MIKFLFLPLVLLIFSCEKKSVFSEDFVLAYAELRIAEREHGITDDGRAARLQILQKHGLSVETFEEKMEEIKKEPSEWKEFQNKLIIILDSIGNEREE